MFYGQKNFVECGIMILALQNFERIKNVKIEN